MFDHKGTEGKKLCLAQRGLADKFAGMFNLKCLHIFEPANLCACHRCLINILTIRFVFLFPRDAEFLEFIHLVRAS